jgi:hypothetical protein
VRFDSRNSNPRQSDLELPSPHPRYTRIQKRQGAMNPEFKLILDELKKNNAMWEQCFNDLDAKWDRQIS